jgi:CHAT domain-containing protein
VKGGSATVIPAATAVLYPIIFSDRVELLLQSATGITRFTSKVSSSVVRDTAKKFASDLRYGSKDYLTNAQLLYNWLLRPLEASAAAQHIAALVIVPDGALRLVAMGALHDGKRFAIEKYSLSTVTGLSMTNTNRPPAQDLGFLVAGVSEPGPVVDKLTQNTVDQIFSSTAENVDAGRGLKKSRSMRSLRFIPLGTLDNAKDDKTSRSAKLREALALPGVKQEIDAIHQIMPGTSMLNASFTAGGFRQEAESGSYRIIHIATHGVFGGSAETSYVLAYDDLLTLDSLQSMLKSEHFRKNPIELLTLSACETAEGDDRSPLGISGAAMKARAKSVLGSLWPVDDDAARKAMETFYLGIAKYHLSKAESLRRAQVELLHNDEFAHPLFWAPFVLIGNWL